LVKRLAARPKSCNFSYGIAISLAGDQKLLDSCGASFDNDAPHPFQEPPVLTRTTILASLVCAALLAMRVQAECNSADPLSFGVQARAVLNPDGIVRLRFTLQHMVPEMREKLEQVTTEVELDGKKKTVVESVTKRYTVLTMDCYCSERLLPLRSFKATDMSGKPIAPDKLAAALKQETTVLLATRDIAPFYLSVYKPETILLVSKELMAPIVCMPPPPGAPVEAPVARGPVVEVPRPAPAPGPAPAPAPIEAPRPVPAPAPFEAPVLEAGPGPNLNSTDGQGMAGMPSVVLAHKNGATIGLRSYLKDVSFKTVIAKVEVDGVMKDLHIQICTESVSDIESKYPAAALKITRADKKPITVAEIEQLLAKVQPVLLSADGKGIDAQFLKIVRPEALLVIAPMPEMAPPVAAPARAMPVEAPRRAPPAAPPSGT